MFNCRTKEEMFVCLKYCLQPLVRDVGLYRDSTYARTFEKSLEGDMTKLSLPFDQEIRCCMFGSSSILVPDKSVYQVLDVSGRTYLYSLCMNAVCTTFGC